MDEENTNTVDILQGTVAEVKAAASGLAEADLQTLLDAEKESASPRKGVLAALSALIADGEEENTSVSPRTAEQVQAELEEAEDGPTDITNAQRIQHLRGELAALGK